MKNLYPPTSLSFACPAASVSLCRPGSGLSSGTKDSSEFQDQITVLQGFNKSGFTGVPVGSFFQIPGLKIY